MLVTWRPIRRQECPQVVALALVDEDLRQR
jgi:hypothetical protein